MMDSTIVNVAADAASQYATILFAVAYIASEIIGHSKLNSNGLLHLIFNISKAVISMKKKEGK